MEEKDVTWLHWLVFFKPTGAVAFTTAQFGVGSDLVYLDEVDCNGSESHLIDCSRNTFIAVTRPTDTTDMDMGGASTDIHVVGLEWDVKVSVKWMSISTF